MSFQKRRVGSNKKQTAKRRPYKKTSYTKRKRGKKKSSLWFKLLAQFIVGLLLFWVLGLFVLYQKVIAPLPSIKELENIEIAESSVIYDRDWNELYKIFEEKRTYVNYDQINKNIINALVAGEDKRYWENPGVDFIGLVRAGIYGVIWKNEGFGWTSTLTQQLIRNTIIANRSSTESIFEKLERKIKEIYLAFKLTNGVSKEKIIELYLNKIAYGSNAYGIEQASETFFGKKASEVWILEASMLASLPKGPSYYSPYSNYDRLVGYPYVYNPEDVKKGDESESGVKIISEKSMQENKAQLEALKKLISGMKAQRYSDSKVLLCGLERENFKSNISIDTDGCSVMDYSEFLVLLNSIKISSGNLVTEYQTGRKDFILGRMLEDKYISFDEYKEALLGSIGFSFQKYKEDIKYPHFVFYVREFLEEKYGKELLEKWGLKIYTSIDPKLQEKAEEIVKKQAKVNKSKFAADNAALISLDNETGEILAMVGGRDYFDEENKGNVNMVTAALQPGSSFKPFVYSLAIDQEIVGTKTPIYDVKTTFPGRYTPQNFDGRFKGKMTVSTALNHSRNIPAIKMYFLAGGEEKILKWMEKLGVSSIRKFKEEYSKNSGTNYSYGASMALWSVMMTPLELAEAYSVFANMWYKKDVVPVIKILDSKGLVIEEFQKENIKKEKVIDPATAFITNHILSDTSARPSFWNKYLSLSGRKAAAKTGTSTKGSSGRWKTIYPRNLWTAGYTPQVTTIVWAGNNDGSPTNLKWNGLEWAGPIWKEFMEFYHKGKGELEWKMPSGVKKVNISEISGKLAPDGFNPKYIVSSLFVNAPQSYDDSLRAVQVDLLCNGKVQETTPISAIGNVNFLSFQSLRPDLAYWELPVQEWVSKWEFIKQNDFWASYITSINENTCERTALAGKIEVWATVKPGDTLVNGANYIEIWYRSDSPIKQLEVYLGDKKIKHIDVLLKKKWVYSWNINIPKWTLGNKTLLVKAIDSQYYSEAASYDINVIKSDGTPPEITITNPANGSISLYPEDFFNLRGSITDRSTIRSINIYLDGSPLKIWLQGREFVYQISAEWLSPGAKTIKVEAVDADFNIWSTEVSLNILEK